MSSSAGKTSATIKRTGDMMLSGWKLLAMSCPECHTALMSKSDETRCPGCDLPVFKEGDHRISGAPTRAEPKAVVEEPRSLEELKKEYDLRNRGQNAISAKLGERMLAGWTMLALTCPSGGCGGTPLMSLRGGPMLCVACGLEYVTSSFGDLEVAGSRAAPSAAAAVSFAVAESELPAEEEEEAEEQEDLGFDFASLPLLGVAAFAADERDASHKIAQKLVRGWALLDEVCPSAACAGSTPLMRDHDGNKSCVECGYAVTRSGEPIIASRAAEVKVSVAPASARVAAQRVAAAADSEEEDEEDEEDAEGFFADWRRRLAPTAQSASAGPSEVQTRSSDARGAAVRGGELCDAAAGLRDKLRVSVAALAASESIEKSTRLAVLISALGDALRSVEGLARPDGGLRVCGQPDDSF